MPQSADLKKIASLRESRKNRVERDRALAMAERSALATAMVAANAALEAAYQAIQAAAKNTPLMKESRFVTGLSLRQHSMDHEQIAATLVNVRDAIACGQEQILQMDAAIATQTTVLRGMEKSFLKIDALIEAIAKDDQLLANRHEERRGEEAVPFALSRSINP